MLRALGELKLPEQRLHVLSSILDKIDMLREERNLMVHGTLGPESRRRANGYFTSDKATRSRSGRVRNVSRRADAGQCARYGCGETPADAADLPLNEIIPCNKSNRLTPAGLKGMAEGGVMGAIG